MVTAACPSVSLKPQNPKGVTQAAKAHHHNTAGWKPASARRTCWGFPVDLAIYTLTSTSTYTYGYQFNSDHSSHNTNSITSPPNLYWRYINGHRRAPCPAPSSDTELLHSSDKFHHPSCNSTGPAGDTNPFTLQERQGCPALVFRKRSNVAKWTPDSLSKIYPNATTPPPLPHTAGYPGHALFFLLENVRHPSLRTKHSLWTCTKSGEQKPAQTQNDDKGKIINQTNYHQRGLGLQTRRWFLHVLV